jgi:CDP-L-myo-inositol myo-inositolphosphotransferase
VNERGGDVVDIVSKPLEDGLISTLINHRLSNKISQRLVNTRVTPNSITILDFLLCLFAAILFSFGRYFFTVLAGLITQSASIIDGCDGEIARMRSEATPFGAWLDTVLDRYADCAITVGISYAYWLRHPDPRVWILGLVALTGFVLASYTRKEYQIRYHRPPPGGIFQKMSKRDLRLFGLMAGALLNRPYEAMVVLGLVSHACVVWSFLATYGGRFRR